MSSSTRTASSSPSACSRQSHHETVMCTSIPRAWWPGTEQKMSYLPFCRVTVTDADPPGDRSWPMFAFTPGPAMFRLCEALPLSTATNVYVPGLKLVLDKAMWNSVSVAITLVPLAEELPPEAGLEVERARSSTTQASQTSSQPRAARR